MEKSLTQNESVIKPPEKIRFHLLDTIRGIMIIGVLINHFLLDLELEGFQINMLNNPAVSIILEIGRFMFVFLAGITCNLTRSNLRRAAICLGAAFGISLVTYLFLRDFFVYIGILHLLGFMMLLYAGIEKLKPFSWIKRKKTAAIIGAIIFLALYFVTYSIYYKEKGLWFFGYRQFQNSPLYNTFIGYIMGFGGYKPTSADYFPLMPWGFAFFAGACLGYLFKHNLVPKFFTKPIWKPLTTIGRHTLIIYILHQPIIWGLAQLIKLIFLN